mmetsp:Transcript_120417/g.286105  ORF Transcript_120417/g.286105 Transcript_120417/m.286105 type:complete len:259 (-) Transcript_120417:573-1349(-)
MVTLGTGVELFGSKDPVEGAVGAAHQNRARSVQHRRAPVGGPAKGLDLLSQARQEALQFPCSLLEAREVRDMELPNVATCAGVHDFDAGRHNLVESQEGPGGEDHRQLLAAPHVPHGRVGVAGLVQQARPGDGSIGDLPGSSHALLAWTTAAVLIIAAAVDQPILPQHGAPVAEAHSALRSQAPPDLFAIMEAQAIHAASKVHEEDSSVAVEERRQVPYRAVHVVFPELVASPRIHTQHLHVAAVRWRTAVLRVDACA